MLRPMSLPTAHSLSIGGVQTTLTTVSPIAHHGMEGAGLPTTRMDSLSQCTSHLRPRGAPVGDGGTYLVWPVLFLHLEHRYSVVALLRL